MAEQASAVEALASTVAASIPMVVFERECAEIAFLYFTIHVDTFRQGVVE
jgi:hypothetical protein